MEKREEVAVLLLEPETQQTLQSPPGRGTHQRPTCAARLQPCDRNRHPLCADVAGRAEPGFELSINRCVEASQLVRAVCREVRACGAHHCSQEHLFRHLPGPSLGGAAGARRSRQDVCLLARQTTLEVVQKQQHGDFEGSTSSYSFISRPAPARVSLFSLQGARHCSWCAARRHGGQHM